MTTINERPGCRGTIEKLGHRPAVINGIWDGKTRIDNEGLVRTYSVSDGMRKEMRLMAQEGYWGLVRIDPAGAGPRAIIASYAEVARPLLIAVYGIHSCVQSTRVTIACLERFRVRARAVPVSLLAQSANASWACGLTEEEQRGLQAGAFVVDRRAPGQTWKGHQVAIADGKGCRYLIDASIDQIDFGERDAGLPPLVPPMILFHEFDGRHGGTPLDGFTDYLSADLPKAPGISVRYKEIADRTHIAPGPGEMESLRPAVDRICHMMTGGMCSGL